MKCNEVKGEIDQLFLNQNPQLSTEARSHIAECPSCNEFYASTVLAGQFSNKLKSATPVLTNPEQLTETIMLGINRENKSNRSLFTSLNLQRLLAAASICLFIIFGYEQYNVLVKINRLETETKAVSNSQSGLIQLNGSLEGFLLFKSNILKIKAPEYFKNINLKELSGREILASLNQLGVSSLSLNEINQFIDKNKTGLMKYSEPGVIESFLQLNK